MIKINQFLSLYYWNLLDCTFLFVLEKFYHKTFLTFKPNFAESIIAFSVKSATDLELFPANMKFPVNCPTFS